MPQDRTGSWQVWLLVYEMGLSGKHVCTWTSEGKHNDSSMCNIIRLSSSRLNDLISTDCNLNDTQLGVSRCLSVRNSCVHVGVCVCVCVCVCMYVCIYLFMYICMYLFCIYVYIYLFLYKYLRIYIYMYVCIYFCM